MRRALFAGARKDQDFSRRRGRRCSHIGALRRPSHGAQCVGPSTTKDPYVLPSHADVKTASILTVGDLPAGDGYRMVGIPDGMGAVNINRRFFKLMMNHELGATAGIAEDGQIAELQVHNTLLF